MASGARSAALFSNQGRYWGCGGVGGLQYAFPVPPAMPSDLDTLNKRFYQSRAIADCKVPLLLAAKVLFGFVTKVPLLWLDRFDNKRLNTQGWNFHGTKP